MIYWYYWKCFESVGTVFVSVSIPNPDLAVSVIRDPDPGFKNELKNGAFLSIRFMTV